MTAENESSAEALIAKAMRRAELCGTPHRMAAMPESIPAIDISVSNLRAIMEEVVSASRAAAYPGKFDCYANAEPALTRLALEESVRLQAHYAALLNQYDGGKRIVFASADEWIARLRALTRPAEPSRKHEND